jgi:hypothetical protein
MDIDKLSNDLIQHISGFAVKKSLPNFATPAEQAKALLMPYRIDEFEKKFLAIPKPRDYAISTELYLGPLGSGYILAYLHTPIHTPPPPMIFRFSVYAHASHLLNPQTNEWLTLH